LPGHFATESGGQHPRNIKSGNQKLVLDHPLNLNSNYSIAISVFSYDTKNSSIIAGFRGTDEAKKLFTSAALTTGHWHYLVKTVNGTSIKGYIDGHLINSLSILNNNNNNADSLIIGTESKFSGAIAEVSVYNNTLTANEVVGLNELWIKNLHSPADTLFYKQKPKALSPGIISMRAGYNTLNSTNNIQFEFTRLLNGTAEKESGWLDNPYYIDFGLTADKQYSYVFKVKDNSGNVSPGSPLESASTLSAKFNVFTDNFSTGKDYLTTNASNSGWDGFIGKGDKQSAIKIYSDGKDTLILESEGTNWDGSVPCGPFLYKNIKGDFIAEVEVSDISGLVQKKVLGNNDAGLMIREPNGLSTGEQLIQNSIFPAWNVGNLLTNLVDGNRRQLNTQSGWNYNKYLQIQRDGNMFYLRTSKDDINWVDLPGTPVLRDDLDKKEVQVGLYQCTYGPIKAFASFLNFSLVSAK
jgi:hypothetical protein